MSVLSLLELYTSVLSLLELYMSVLSLLELYINFMKNIRRASSPSVVSIDILIYKWVPDG